MLLRPLSTMASSTASARSRTTKDTEHDKDHPLISTLASFTEDEVESTVNAVFGAASSMRPRRFAMEDILRVDQRSIGLLQVSSRWKGLLPHIERIIETERVTPTNCAGFVARTFRQRPGVVYAVRYWEELAGTTALTSALEHVRQAWLSASRRSNTKLNSNQGVPSCFDGNAADSSSQVDRKSEEATVKPTEDQALPASVADRENSERAPASSQEQVILTEGDASSTAAVGTPAAPQPASLTGPGRVGPGCGAQSHITKDTAARTSLVPEDTVVLRSTPSERSSPVKVLGFAVGNMDSSKVNVALVSEWPGIGSLHDLLSGKIHLPRGASQEDLLRWTRQVAEGLVHVSRRDLGGGVCEAALNVCTRNAFLFLRPRDEFQEEGADTLDVRVATFLGGFSTPDAGKAVESCRYVLPPEFLWATPDHIVWSSPTKFNITQGQGHINREAADVWGMGTLAFELSTGRVAGPTPLAFRQLRDLLRDVPIDPRFIYGDVARGVMRLALKTRPGDRARAAEVAAVVEQIAARTLRRAHTASDRQSHLKRMRLRAAAEDPAGGGRTGEDGGLIDDGYGQALAQWRTNEAVERAEGRAKAFLRQLWFNSLTKDDKRRIRHRRRHRKANKEAREWRGRRVRAARMHHWTPVQVASWISHLLRRAEASRKLPLLCSGDAKGGTVCMDGDEAENNATGGTTKPNGEETSMVKTIPAKDGPDAVVTATAASTTDKQACAPEGATSGASTVRADIADRSSLGASAADPATASDSQGVDSITATDLQKKGDTINAAEVAETGQDDDENNFHDPDQGDNVYDNGEDDDDLSSSVEGGKGSDGWADIEEGERTGYSGAEVEPFAVQEGIDGSCVIEAMDDAMEHAEDALTRFVKSSIRLARPAEVEKKRVDLMVRELLTIRPYSAPSQIKIRALGVVIVRSAEAPRNLAQDEVTSQLPSLARVLTAGYRHQTAMVEQGLEFAAARIQGLARGKHARRIVSAIWRQAEEYARNIVQGEREARMKKEIEERAKAKEEALEREREEAKRYRLRLVPRASSVTSRSMIISLPAFMVAAARGARRFLVVETTVVPPRPLQQQPPPLPHTPEGVSCAVGTAAATVATADGNSVENSSSSWQRTGGEGLGQVYVLLRQGSAVELKAASESESTSPTPTPLTVGTVDSGPANGSRGRATLGARNFLRAVGNGLSVTGLRPCTMYRLTLEVPPVVRDDLLESARSLGLTEAVRSLEIPTGSETNGDHESSGEVGSVASTAVHLDVETLPDVPSEVSLVSCKVLTSASAVDPRDPDGVLSLRQWQSPYPGVANMDSASSEDYVVLAPGRPEPLVSLQWNEPESNGLDICSYIVERRIGPKGSWKRIRVRGGDGADEGGPRRLPNAVDAPLRTISVDALRKVAIQGLTLGYRVYAENVLGDGSPSKPVEVNLRAFLGHLRAQEGTGRMHAAQQENHVASMRPALASFPAGHGDPLVSTTRPASSADGVPDRTVGNNDASSYSKPPGPAVEREVQQQQVGRLAEAGRNAQGAIPQPSVSSPPPAFGGDFMGLGGFGEDLVDNLFAPPSSSSRHRRRRRSRAPAAGGALGVPSLDGEGNIGANGPYALPPIVLVTGISGESRLNATTTNLGSDGKMLHGDGGAAERDHANKWRDFAMEGNQNSVNTTNNDVFHAFINLGRRLPGRLRR